MLSTALLITDQSTVLKDFGYCIRERKFFIDTFSIFLVFIGLIILSVSCFIKKPIVITIAAVVIAVSDILYYLAFENKDLFDIGERGRASWIFYCVAATIMVFMGISKKVAKYIGFISGSLYLIGSFLYKGSRNFPDFLYTYKFPYLLLGVGVILLGIAISSKESKIALRIKNDKELVTYSSVDSDLERLTRLKDLLDKGIISQEEFDLKKKDILG